MPCSSCHQGHTPAKDKLAAHEGLIAQPSHPDHLQQNCGECHGDKTDQIQKTLHFTLANSTNLFRKSFGAIETLSTFRDTPATQSPATALELADDLLNISGSPIHLTKTVMNLVSNAAEATVGDGEVRIATQNRYIDTPINGYDDIEEGDYVIAQANAELRDARHFGQVVQHRLCRVRVVAGPAAR